MTTREAKEFLISRICAQAEDEGAPLDDIERRMLYFTETAWMPSDTWQASEVFDRDYDQNAYEARISALVQHLKAASSFDRRKWNEAVRILRTEDHYLLVLIAPTAAAPYSFLKLVVIATAGLGLLAAAYAVYLHFFPN
jgi:hypothetical protein